MHPGELDAVGITEMVAAWLHGCDPLRWKENIAWQRAREGLRHNSGSCRSTAHSDIL